MSDNKFSISMDKSGVERSGWIVSSVVGLKGLYIISCDVYRTQSDLNDICISFFYCSCILFHLVSAECRYFVREW